MEYIFDIFDEVYLQMNKSEKFTLQKNENFTLQKSKI